MWGVDHHQLGRVGAPNQGLCVLQMEGQGAIGGAAGGKVGWVGGWVGQQGGRIGGWVGHRVLERAAWKEMQVNACFHCQQQTSMHTAAAPPGLGPTTPHLRSGQGSTWQPRLAATSYSD